MSTSTDDQKNLRSILAELLKVESGLTEWEIEFLDSLNSRDGDLTERQAAKLVQIYHKLKG